jgi:predicted transcriptional regulator
MSAAIYRDDVVDTLRRLLPERAVTWSEAHSVAERQAALLLKLLYIDEPPVPQFVISSLSGIVVDRQADWPTDGMAVQGPHHWRIVLNADALRQRQRFSLAHEFKHILDDPVVERLYRHLSPERRRQRAERLCNYFSACLLMPRTWVKRDWCAGRQRPRELARRYYVSVEAMTTRLSELGLGPTTAASEPSQRQGCNQEVAL